MLGHELNRFSTTTQTTKITKLIAEKVGLTQRKMFKVKRRKLSD